MTQAVLTLHPHFKIGAINPRIYGSFIEHLGRAVYNGIYEPTHPTADENGFREDVKALVREMNVPIIRYPGGNFLSGYKWEDGVGPKENRPRKLDPAWRQLEPNEVGTDEFHQWAKEVGTEVMMAVNLGTRGPAEAAELLEYCNMPGGSEYADMRVKNGHPAPYRDEVWCLGNEMDGPWQIGVRTAEDYADIARKTAGLMKKIDPSVKLVACGSSNSYMPTFIDWERTVLERGYEDIDYISLHMYYSNWKTDRPAYIANSVSMDQFIESVVAICDAVGAKKRSKKKINLSFDEWNIWPETTRCDNEADPWTIGPRREEFFHSLEDALLFGGMMLSLIRHCDRVEMACQAQLVNVGGPIMTQPGGGIWKQPSFYPFSLTSTYGRGEALRMELDSDTYEVKELGEVPYLDCAAVQNGDELVIFAINRAQTEENALRVDLSAFGPCEIIEHIVLENDDIDAINTYEDPDRVKPHANGNAQVCGNGIESTLAPYSWNMIRISLK